MKKIIFTLLFLLIPYLCFSACTGLPKSGQTIEYQSGDDGTYEEGWVGTRFTDNADGTVTDNATGLMWVQDPSLCGDNWGSEGSPTAMTWSNAIINTEALTYATYSDWRLPNVKELMSIVDYGTFFPAINETFFAAVAAGYYWTSTTEAADGSAWYIDFAEGNILYNMYDNVYYVRPVRGSTGGGGAAGGGGRGFRFTNN